MGAAALPGAKGGFIITSDGVRIHYLEAGKGPPIVFVPGWTMPAEIWEPQIARFSNNYRVVAVDPRSQGESDRPTEGHYPERRAQDIKELAEQLRLAPVVLVGWSMGVSEVLAYVEQFGTSTLRAVVLVDGMFSPPGPQFVATMGRVLRQMQANRAAWTDQFVRSMYRRPQPEDYLRKIIAASLKTPTNTAVTLSANMTAGDWTAVLSRLDKPVLYVYASPMLKPQAALVKEQIPGATVEAFEDAGHALFVDEAERFNAVLEKFLKSLGFMTGSGDP